MAPTIERAQSEAFTRLSGSNASLWAQAGATVLCKYRDALEVAPESVCTVVGTEQNLLPVIPDMARITRDDVLVDLGCGDGRVIVHAARKYGCRCVGFDIRASCCEDTQQAARTDGVEDLVEAIQFNMMSEELASHPGWVAATVVYAYLMPDVTFRLENLLRSAVENGKVVILLCHTGSRVRRINGPRPGNVIGDLPFQREAMMGRLRMYCTERVLEQRGIEPKRGPLGVLPKSLTFPSAPCLSALTREERPTPLAPARQQLSSLPAKALPSSALPVRASGARFSGKEVTSSDSALPAFGHDRLSAPALRQSGQIHPRVGAQGMVARQSGLLAPTVTLPLSRITRTLAPLQQTFRSSEWLPPSDTHPVAPAAATIPKSSSQTRLLAHIHNAKMLLSQVNDAPLYDAPGQALHDCRHQARADVGGPQNLVPLLSRRPLLVPVVG